MLNKPRKMTDTFLNLKELSMSIIQGIIITIGVLFAYQFAVYSVLGEEKTRSLVFTTLIFANILLSLVNRSFIYSVVESVQYKNKLFPIVIFATLVSLFAILYIPSFSRFFQLAELDLMELFISFLIAVVSVLWFEVYKGIKRRQFTRLKAGKI